jgi:DGQHR domain-containing protein
MMELRVPAIQVQQTPETILYTFAVDGKLIAHFATVSRIRRNDGMTLQGYQRPEVVSHIAEIRNYLESETPMMPNAVVIAFDSRVRFEADHSAPPNGYTHLGTLVIPIDSTADAEKPGFIVDGQQRLAAIREAEVDAFPIMVTAFITDDIGEQTEQFILVNSTKPLPKGLIYELLPSTESPLPRLLQRRRFPSYLLDRLNRDEDSPLRFLIQTPTTPQGAVKDNSILRMLENSLIDGVLYRYRDTEGTGGDVNTILSILKAFWSAAANVFTGAWGLSPRRSRLMHGAGIVSLGFIMDAIAERYRHQGIPTREQFTADLQPLAAICRWTDGFWNFGPGQQRKWNEIQNTSKDIQLLANYLLYQYKTLVWSPLGEPTLSDLS